MPHAKCASCGRGFYSSTAKLCRDCRSLKQAPTDRGAKYYAHSVPRTADGVIHVDEMYPYPELAEYLKSDRVPEGTVFFVPRRRAGWVSYYEARGGKLVYLRGSNESLI